MGAYNDILLRNETENNICSKFLGSHITACAYVKIFNVNNEEKDIIIYEDSDINIQYIKEVNFKFKLIETKCRLSKFDWIMSINGPLLKGIYIDISNKNKSITEYIEVEDIRDLFYI